MLRGEVAVVYLGVVIVQSPFNSFICCERSVLAVVGLCHSEALFFRNRKCFAGGHISSFPDYVFPVLYPLFYNDTPTRFNFPGFHIYPIHLQS
ncbi:unnamed protein product [Meloidogyne enterolobii]|uniref:Uncharacterized protein n=1 Tax=Meloidogyne enterolobii TaxID=390850 RepID=A0ACB0Y5B7_MELEN